MQNILGKLCSERNKTKCARSWPVEQLRSSVLFFCESKACFVSFPCLTDEAKGSFGETFHLKTVVRTGVLGIQYWIEVRMESEEEHTGRKMEANTQSGSLKHYLLPPRFIAHPRMVFRVGIEASRCTPGPTNPGNVDFNTHL